jgi:hypothetical protein
MHAQAGLDLPAAPLFKDVMDKVIIPQVPIFDILRKFDGELVHEDIKAGEELQGRYRWRYTVRYEGGTRWRYGCLMACFGGPSGQVAGCGWCMAPCSACWTGPGQFEVNTQ